MEEVEIYNRLLNNLGLNNDRFKPEDMKLKHPAKFLNMQLKVKKQQNL